MFYNRENCAFYIQDIFSVTRKNGVYENKRRKFAGLAFRLSGGSVFISENERICTPEGSITYIPAGVDFNIESTDEEVIILHLSVFGETEIGITSVTPAHAYVYADFFKDAIAEWKTRRPGYINRCMAIVYNIFAALEKEVFSEKSRTKELIEKGVLYMNMYFDNRSISVSDIAKKCSISEVYFRRIFKDEYGISPLKYLNNLRMERAKQLLESGYYRVSEAAALSGFEDMKYFSTAFKKSVGITPIEYLKKHREA